MSRAYTPACAGGRAGYTRVVGLHACGWCPILAATVCFVLRSRGFPMALRVGQSVPDQTVQAYVRGERGPSEFALSSHSGRWVVLFFYPRDFTFICPTELASFA